MTPLDPLNIPLRGLALIEASAGTGKTYTISTLYLRLLLEAELEVDRILVVTFTQAATEELRERIRSRLSQALALLQGRWPEGKERDEILEQLLTRLPDQEAAAATLADALTRMDEAAIHTIHGFCQRMLQDNAFESGLAFEVDFITDEARFRATAAADFWRSRVAAADPEQAAQVVAQWSSPGALLQTLGPTLALDDLRLLPEGEEADPELLRQRLGALFTQLQTLWRERGDEVEELLRNSPALNRRSYNKGVVTKAIDAAQAVAARDAPPAEFPPGFERLFPSMLAEKGTKPGADTPSHPFFDLCGQLQELTVQSQTAASALFLQQARRYIRDALERRKRDEALLYFDDLLRRLDQAIAGPGGEALAANLRQRFPVALIDEFQDTDPQQFRIFRHTYAGHPECGLFLIGDPKQAIYAFRGADIFTYMEARDQAERQGGQYTLETNWRSGSRLIQALNTLFTAADNPFIYRPHIDYRSVLPSPKADEKPLLLDGEEPVPLQFWMLSLSEENQSKRPPGFIRKDAAMTEAAAACAGRIATLLNRADAGQARLGKEPLQPGDIALLVRTHKEGDRVQQALRAHGVNSVTLSQESVFHSEDAEELEMLLLALGEITDESRMRAALATALLGYDAPRLERVSRDETAWEQVLVRFQEYRELWQSRGFMIALQRLLDQEGIGPRLLQRPDGERRLTNLLQLLELLQIASREHPGIDGLLRWFEDQRSNEEMDDARQLRLESDEGLVKVVTMHKSKGLEYPLVFIPFPWSYFNPPNPSPPFFHSTEDRSACLDFGSSQQDEHRRLEATEQLAERLRLFYVSVTRAAKLCVLCWGKINQAEGSAMAYLLHPNTEAETPASRMKGMEEQEIRRELEQLAAAASCCIAVLEPPADTEQWAGPRVERERLAAADFSARIDDAWRVSSYSGLVRGSESEQPDYDAVVVVTEGDEPQPPSEEPLFDLPAGTHTGHFLHELFENLDFPAAGGESLQTQVRELLERYGRLASGREVSEGTDWSPVVVELVQRVLATPLDESGRLRLGDIGMEDRLTELEFHFPHQALEPELLQEALAPYPQYAASARGLAFEPRRGLMRGFIDLAFRHQGRFYVLDYKSNLLGRRLQDYGRTGMQQAVREHRYDLQYLIYTLALHRFLGTRLPDYDYQQHFGGVYYLFLRGMHPDRGAEYGVWRDRPELELIQRLDQLFGGGGGTS